MESKVSQTKDLALMVVDIWYTTGVHDRWEEFLLYDWDSLIADVGGYLGLLLGHSIYSVFSEISAATLKKMSSA